MGTLSRHSRPELPTLSLTWHVNIQGTQHQWHSCKARKQGRAKQHYLFIIQWIHAAVCEQSVDRSNLLLLKFTNLQLAEHFNYNTLFYFFKSLLLLYSLSHLLCLIISLSLSLFVLFALSHYLTLSLLFLFNLSHYLTLSLSLSFAVSFILLDSLSLSFTVRLSCPKGWLGYVWCHPPVWNTRAVTRFLFPITSLVFLPSPLALSVV